VGPLLAEEEPEQSTDDEQTRHASDNTSDDRTDICVGQRAPDLHSIWGSEHSLVVLPPPEPPPAVALLTAEVLTVVDPSELVLVTMLGE
jgi:hypothetical protein